MRPLVDCSTRLTEDTTVEADPDVCYCVTESDCECRAAAEGDRVCKHRAMLRHRLGTLSLDPDPAPVAPVVPLPRRTSVVEVLALNGRVAYRSDKAAKRAA